MRLSFKKWPKIYLCFKGLKEFEKKFFLFNSLGSGGTYIVPPGQNLIFLIGGISGPRTYELREFETIVEEPYL